jgi:hypothetical protein
LLEHNIYLIGTLTRKPHQVTPTIWAHIVSTKRS